MQASAEFSRGWRSLLAASVGNGSGLSGLAYYTFGVFVLPLTAAFGWTRGETSIAASFLIVGTAITAPIIGSIIDRYGARRVGISSMLLLAAGYAALTQLDGSIATFYASWLGLSLVGGGTTPVVWTRTVNLWFDRGRGLALGLALAGSGLAGVFAPVLTTRIISTYGWQAGYLALGAFIVVFAVPVLALMLRDKPADGVSVTADALPEGTMSRTGLTLQQSLRTAAFWKIAIGFFLVSAVVAALIMNLIPLLVDRGLDREQASQIAGTMGIAVLIGRVGIGSLLDRFSASLVARVLLGLCAAGCFALTLPDLSVVAVIACALSLGLAAAAEVDLVSFLTSRFFGMREYGKIYGWQLTAFYIGAALGPLGAGLSFDHFQSYLPTIYFAIGSMIFGALVIGSLGEPPRFED